MKKMILGFATLALLTTSCNNEVIDSSGLNSNQIAFSPVTGKQTKAVEADLQYFKNNGAIPLYAFHTDEAGVTKKYFEEQLNWDNTDSKWATDVVRFLPSGGSLKFYTYYPTTPANATFTIADETAPAPKLGYTVASLAADQEDLMVAVENIASVNTAGSNNVTLKYKHILSQVNFGVKGYTGAKITISNIRVVEVDNSATFDLNSSTWADYAGNTIDYNYMTVANHETDGADGDVTYIFGDGGKFGPGAASTTLKYPNVANSNSLMLMPQNVITKKFLFDYVIEDLDPVAPAVIASKTDAEAPLSAGSVDEWLQNKRYVYIIDFTDFLDGRKLTFDIDLDVYDWENYNQSTDDDGIVKINAVGPIPTIKDNGTTNFESLMIADLTWNFTDAFVGIDDTHTYEMKFAKVAFNSYKVTVNFNPVEVSATLNGATVNSGFEIKNPTDVVKFTKIIAPMNVSDMVTYLTTNDAVKDAAYPVNESGTSVSFASITAGAHFGLTAGDSFSLRLKSAITNPTNLPFSMTVLGNVATYTVPYTNAALVTKLGTATAGSVYYCNDDVTGLDLKADFTVAGLNSFDKIYIVFASQSGVVPTGLTDGWSYDATKKTATYKKP